MSRLRDIAWRQYRAIGLVLGCFVIVATARAAYAMAAGWLTAWFSGLPVPPPEAMAGLLVTAALAKGLAFLAERWVMVRVAEDEVFALRQTLVRHLLVVDPHHLGRVAGGDSAVSVGADADRLGRLLHPGLTNLSRAALMVFILGAAAVWLDPVIGGLGLLGLPAAAAIVVVSARRLHVIAKARGRIEAVRLDARVNAFPAGLHTRLANHGGDLSAGERRRLALARALYSTAPILVLDEPTASLDGDCEGAVASAIRKAETVLVTTHRLSTALLADEVVVLDGGRIVKCGPPSVLWADRGPFYELFRAQGELLGLGAEAR